MKNLTVQSHAVSTAKATEEDTIQFIKSSMSKQHPNSCTLLKIRDEENNHDTFFLSKDGVTTNLTEK